MNKSRYNILVVEDDPTQGKALQEALSRQGYTVVICTASVPALSQAQRMEFHCLIVDCMLPKMNGVDLTEEILGIAPSRPRVILFSGIFRDKEFTRDAVKRTDAAAFLFKPLNLEEVLHLVNEGFASYSGPSTPPVMRLYGSQDFTDKTLTKLIEEEPTIHAFHLPMLYQRIFQTVMSGELTLISAVGDVSSVCFFEGQVFQVKTPDRESYFGSLAVSQGFVSTDEVAKALNTPDKKPIGEKLIASLSLSPHAIHLIVEEQMALRLSQTIQDDVVSLQWVDKKFANPSNILPAARFETLLEDWLDSKLTHDWIRTTLMSWGPFQIEGDFSSHIDGKPTVEDLFANPQFRNDEDLQFIFRALALGHAFMGDRGEETRNFTFLESRLDQMQADFKQHNLFQVLGVSEKAASREVSRSYEELKEAFDPARLPANCPTELKEKAEAVFSYIEKARAILGDDVERMRYLQRLQNKRDQEMLEAEPIFRAAILEINNGHYKQAGNKFQSLIDRKIEFKDLRAYRLWAGLKEKRGFNTIRLDQIPPESRHSVPYMMAKGIHLRGKAQFKKAMEAFRTAHVLDPRLSEAKTELQVTLSEVERLKGPGREFLREATAIVDTIIGRRRGA